jgi:hypothetical protein
MEPRFANAIGMMAHGSAYAPMWATVFAANQSAARRKRLDERREQQPVVVLGRPTISFSVQNQP